MKRIIWILVLVAAGVYVKQTYYSDHTIVSKTVRGDTRFQLQDQSPQQTPKLQTREQTPQFRCDGREYCSQMRSRAEAEFFVRHCPNVKMDGDGDGIPCENDSRW